ncbi:Antirestriction ArdB family protein [Enterobacterales bacterium 8AC]|nr:Antirestriction ArdB family protein [Enterobacterales bacterium 8AC]
MNKQVAVTAEKTDWDTGFRNLVLVLFHQGFSPDSAQLYMMKFTEMCCAYARQFSQDYAGGLWQLYTQSDGGFFVCPQTEKTYRIEVVSNYYQGEMSAQALGMTVSLYALCVLAESEHDFLIESYHRLRAFAVRHPEWAAIGAAID